MKIGSWVQSSSSTIAHQMFLMFDWLAIDMEHTDASFKLVSDIAKSKRDKDLYVRVPSADSLTIRRCLDCGADGIIVPMISSIEQVSQVVNATKYPPIGTRGVSFCQANDFGEKISNEWLVSENKRIKVFVMIETVLGWHNVFEIAAMNGVDGCFVGHWFSRSIAVVL